MARKTTQEEEAGKMGSNDPRPYTVELTGQAEKDLKALRAYLPRVLKAVKALETDPLKGHALKGSLRGVRSLEFSLPGGAHRAAYFVVVDERTCLVFMVGAHEGFYAAAARRYEALVKSGALEPRP